MSGRFKNETVFLTGATGGIGSYAARFCSDEGAHVVFAARSPEKAEALLSSLGDAEAVKADLSDPEQTEALASRLAACPPTAAVLAAGTYFLKGNGTGTEVHLAVNALSPLVLARALAGAGTKRIVYVSSISADAVRLRKRENRENFASIGKTRRYALSKRALEAGMGALAAEFPDTEFIRVHPGVSATGLFTQKNSAFGAAFTRLILPLMKILFMSPEKASRVVSAALAAPAGTEAVAPRFAVWGKPEYRRFTPPTDTLRLLNE